MCAFFFFLKKEGRIDVLNGKAHDVKDKCMGTKIGLYSRAEYSGLVET